MTDDRMHDRLTDAGARWRERQPDLPVAVPRLRERRSGLVVAAAAAVVVAVAGGGWAVSQFDQGQDSHSPSAAPTSASPTSSVTPSGPPACTAPQLHVTSTFEGAMGTTYLTLRITSVGGRCLLHGHPDVTLFDHGTPIGVTQAPLPGRHPRVLVTRHEAVYLSIGWSVTHSCADVDNDSITVTLPDQSKIGLDGFGQTSCNPGEADLQPLEVSAFTLSRR